MDLIASDQLDANKIQESESRNDINIAGPIDRTTKSQDSQVDFAASIVGMSSMSKLTLLEGCLLSKDITKFKMVLDNTKDKSSFDMVFIDACKNGDVEFVELMLDFGVDVNTRHYGASGLTHAALRNRESIVQLLLAHGANVLLTNSLGLNIREMCIHLPKISKMLGDAEVAQRDALASQEAAKKIEESKIHAAAAQLDANKIHESKICDALVPVHLDISKFDKSPIDLKLKVFAALAEMGDSVLCKTLLQNMPDKSGLGNLFTATCEQGNDKAIASMIDCGVDVNIRDNKFGSTGLMFAAQCFHITTVQLLLARGANVLLKSRSGRLARDFTESDIIFGILADAECTAEAQLSVIRTDHDLVIAKLKEERAAVESKKSSIPELPGFSGHCANNKSIDLLTHKTTPDGDEILVTNTADCDVYFQKRGTTTFESCR